VENCKERVEYDGKNKVSKESELKASEAMFMELSIELENGLKVRAEPSKLEFDIFFLLPLF